MKIRSSAGFLFVALASTLFAQNSAVERFDSSGMPPQPTTFVEQQLQDLIQHHTHGDTANAIFIQQKLARYYTDKGDTARARAASRLASEAENGSTSSHVATSSVERFDTSGMPTQA